MKPPLAMLTYSLLFCNRTASVSKGGATTRGPSCRSRFTHLQEMCQHHVHIHVLLLPPTSHEAQVLPAGNGAWLQRLLLCLQERLDRKSELGGVLEHLRAGGKKPPSRKSRGLCEFEFAPWRGTCIFGLTRSESRWKAVDRCPELYCSAGRQSTTKNRTPSWKRNPLFKWPLRVRWNSPGMSIWLLMTCWLAWRISGTDTGIHRAWLRSVSSSFRATRLLPKRFWFI